MSQISSPFFAKPLKNDLVSLIPLAEDHFDVLYFVASDPLIWEQHPNKDRWQLPAFTTYFEGAIKSQGAYLIKDEIQDVVIGSTRYYDYNAEQSTVMIGYTFIARDYWGSGHNHSVKHLMLDYAFQHVDHVLFHIGKDNIRSRTSMERLGGIYCKDIEVAYHGEPVRVNAEYRISTIR